MAIWDHPSPGPIGNRSSLACVAACPGVVHILLAGSSARIENSREASHRAAAAVERVLGPVLPVEPGHGSLRGQFATGVVGRHLGKGPASGNLDGGESLA